MLFVDLELEVSSEQYDIVFSQIGVVLKCQL